MSREPARIRTRTERAWAQATVRRLEERKRDLLELRERLQGTDERIREIEKRIEWLKNDPVARLEFLAARNKAPVEVLEFDAVEAEPAEDAPLARAPPVDNEALAAAQTLEEIRREIERVNLELGRLGTEERGVVQRGAGDVGRAFHFEDYTLYARVRLRAGRRPRVEYSFSAEPVRDGLPVPKPPGHKVFRAGESSVPILVREARETAS